MTAPTHGGDIWVAARQRKLPLSRIVDFSANINPLGISPRVRRRIKRELGLACHYPDRGQEELRSLVSSQEGVHPECIVFGNGATQLLHLIPRCFEYRKALIIEPSFSEYRAALKSCGSKICEFRLEAQQNFTLKLGALLRFVTVERPDVIFLANPNNPTGILIPGSTLSLIVTFCTSHRIDLVVDESFIEFTTARSLASAAFRKRHLIVIRSFTKCFALAGLRVGYLVAHPSVVKRLARRMEPWSVNTLALCAAAESMQDTKYLRRSLSLIRKERRYLAQGLALTGWLESFPSQTNFLLVHIRAPGMDGVCLQQKLEAGNVLIRGSDGFRGLTPRYVRIAIRSRKENKALLSRLRDIGHDLKLRGAIKR
jgi:threonine-phosphate decarboxylase